MDKFFAFSISALLASFAVLKEPPKKGVIAVVDTGISKWQINKPYMCSHIKNHYSLDDVPSVHHTENLSHFTSHGTNVVGLIGSRIDTDKYCIISIAAFKESKKNNMHSYIRSLRLANGIENLVGVNLSLTSEGFADSYSVEEHLIIQKWVNSKIDVIVAAGNKGRQLNKQNCDVYPACLKLRLNHHLNRLHVVGSANLPCVTKDCKYRRHGFSNWSKEFHIAFQNGLSAGSPAKTGTSQSTAIFTGLLFSK